MWGSERLNLRPNRSAWWRPVSVRLAVVGSAWPWRARYRSRVAGTGDLLGLDRGGMCAGVVRFSVWRGLMGVRKEGWAGRADDVASGPASGPSEREVQ